MTKEMEKVTNENSNETLLLANIYNVLDNSITFSFGDNHIEFPGIVIIQREGTKKFITKLLNPGLEIIEIVDSVFDSMKIAIDSIVLDKSKIITDSKIRPIRKNIINLNKLQESAIFVKSTEDSLMINDYVFTNNEAEFHGDGMFTSKKVFFLGFEDMSRIRALFDYNEDSQEEEED